MLKRLTLLSLALVASLTLAFGAPDGEIERRIAALDCVCETKPLPAGPFAGKYEVMLTQPLDWRHPDKGSFEQRVLVMHVGWDRPTVLITQGYD
ncbi:Peptidase S37, tripeptidyl aminopeptidase, partial [human gut metagenome]